MHFYYEDFTGIPEKAKMIKLTAAVTAGTETARGIVQRSWSRDRNQWEELSRVRNAWKQRIPRIWRIKFNLSVYLSMILKIKSIQCTSIVSYSFYVFLIPSPKSYKPSHEILHVEWEPYRLIIRDRQTQILLLL